MTRHLRIGDLAALAVPEQPTLSPDGNRCAYVLRTQDVTADRAVRTLWTVGTRDGEPRALTRGPADSAPAWSPDGTRIAFLRAESGPPQVWCLPVAGGEPEQLTTLQLGAGAPVWSPDGGKIAFTAPVDTLAEPGEDDAARARRANAPIVAERLDYQADGAGLLRGLRQHLHVLDTETGQCRQVTSGDWHAGDPSWSPDGRRLAFAAGTAPDADLTYRAPMYVVDALSGGATPELAGLPDGTGGPSIWTADGTALLVIGHTGSLAGYHGLLRVSLEGDEPVNLAESLDRNVMSGGPAYPGSLPRLVDDGRTVLFCARDRGCTHLYALTHPAPPRKVVGGAGRVVSALEIAGDTAVIVLATPTSFGEIVTVDLATGNETVRTDHGAALADVTLFQRAEREFTITDGTVVEGWLLRDPAVTGPGPLLVDIHGGPHNAWNGAADEIHLYHQELAALGWTVLVVNPRASDGYGEAFHNAALGAWGRADADDILQPIDQLVAEGVADPARLAVAGYSYGAYLTCYLTSHDTRFAAAVAGGVVSDLVSLHGTADDGHLLSELELHAMPWADPAGFAAMSPITEVAKVRTPTLLVQGVTDVTAPMGQAQQWHTALRERGVPTNLVLYPDGAHPFILDGPPSHRMDFNRRVVDWVERYAGDAAGPRPAAVDAGHWRRRLAELAERHQVPGVALGILRLRPGRPDEVVQAAYGVLNIGTGVETTTDSLFQIGSISKVWTSTVVMQLVDEGLLDLDAPIAEVLPDLRLSDPDVAKRVTMRHLLTHTSGIDGDIFTDTGRGDDALEKYVAELAGVAQNHPLGATWSYCNSGFSLAGRVIEKITGQVWDAAMRERLFAKLGLTHTATLPEEVLEHRAAMGHITVEGTVMKAPQWGMPRSAGPAGLICSTPADVLAFARMHLTGGVAADGTRVLREESTAAMADEHAEVPEKHSLGDSWGLGWIRMHWDGQLVIGHDGNTIGQAAFLRILPEQGLAITMLTNGGQARELFLDLYRELFAELAGITMPEPLAPPAEPVTVDLAAWLGRYERGGVLTELSEGDGGPMMRITLSGELAEMMPESERVLEYPLVPIGENLFVTREPEAKSWIPVLCYQLPTGERYVHFGVRATPKVD